MSKVFIVRPFGNRSVYKKDKLTENVSTVKFDFDKVEMELIKPAMQKMNLSGGTTGEVFESGDIREDMFSELLLADIIIADISIFNANVFYELGIRHALRDKRTILIKCPGFDDTPFDIIGYRYISYDKEEPANSIDNLVNAIGETMKADRIDSPVFNILPMLQTQDPEKYLAIPNGFIEEVKIAEESAQAGKLALLAYEAESFIWKFPAFRLIGEALFNLKAFATAKIVFEKIKAVKPNDAQANELLATIYQRLAEAELSTNSDGAISLLAKSDLAIEVLINTDTLSNYQKAEAYSLKARNEKTRWTNSWSQLPGNERSIKALQSLNLENALKNYEKGFYEDLNHFYSGINALGLLTTIISLAESNPDTWELSYDSKKAADQKLKELKNKYQQLSTTIQVSIDAAKSKLEKKGLKDNWLNITEADLNCLTGSNPARVAATYKKVLENAGHLNMDATVRQLKMYEVLGVKVDNVKAALSAIPIESKKQTKYYLLFTGHMIDKPERKEARFPVSKVELVRKSIANAVAAAKEKMEAGSMLTGIAGGACGGDILFHEICAELEIPSQLYLAIPQESFLIESVAFAGNEWIEKFEKLVSKLHHPVLSENNNLPKWLQKKADYNIWTRNNLWELNSALVNGGSNMTMIALWDGKGGDGPGGTADMVKEAKARGAKVVILDINNL